MYANTAVAGGSSVVPYLFIPFHNTPDKAIIKYKYTDKAGNGALFRVKFFDMAGQSHDFDFRQTNTIQNDQEVPISLQTNNLSPIGLDIIFDATGMYPVAPILGNDCSSDLYIDYIRFAYNSTLKGINVGKKAATKGANNTFTHIVDTDLLPQLQFMKYIQVHGNVT